MKDFNLDPSISSAAELASFCSTREFLVIAKQVVWRYGLKEAMADEISQDAVLISSRISTSWSHQEHFSFSPSHN